jgi:conjugal transfer pilin signal peptidase TrbI
MRKRALIGLGCIALSVFIFFVFANLGINRSDSLYFRVYWHKSITSDIQIGRYYLIEYHGNGYSGFINKKAACLSGQTITRVDDMFFCDGALVATLQFTHDEEGNEYPQYEGGRLFGTIFVIGDRVNSYDSRYFGALPITSFRREVTPLW